MPSVAPTLTTGEAVARLADLGITINTDTLRRWARAGRLPAVELPSGQLRFRPEDIDAIAATTAGNGAQ